MIRNWFSELNFVEYRPSREVYDMDMKYNANSENAKLFFNNGFGVSVSTNIEHYNLVSPYELAVLFGNKKNHSVVDYISQIYNPSNIDEVNEIIDKIASLDNLSNLIGCLENQDKEVLRII